MNSVNVPFKNITLLFIIPSILGLLLALSFDPYNIPFLPILIITFFFLKNDYIYKNYKKSLKFFFITGFIFGFSFFLTSIYWISNSISEFNEELVFLTPIPLILLPAVLALFYGVMQMYNSLHWNNSRLRVLFFTSSWIIFELLRSFLFTGFPWGLIAYTWSWSIQFVQIVSVIGVYGLSFLTILCSALIGLSFIKKENFIFLIISTLILILLFSYGHIRIKNYSNSYHDNQYRIVHTNFDQKEKWKKENIEKMASNGSSDLITIFPETAFGMYNVRNSNWFVGHIREEDGHYFNSIDFSNKIYDKKKLVPFGEYIPYERQLEILGLKNLIFMGSMRSGKAQQDFVDNFLPLICYESVFPNFVRKSLKKETELIINISNDAWFGEGTGPQQHFTHTRFRSIEHGITLIRSANKGISALVNPIGKVDHVIESDHIAYLDVKVPKKLSQTAYTKYGESFVYFLIVIFLVIGYANSIINRNN